MSSFWKSVENWWKSILQVTIKLDTCSVIFGIQKTSDDPIIDVMNLCILYAKYYIHTKKTNNEEIFFLEYVKLVKDKLEVEKMACTLKLENTFENRWAFFYDAI